VNAPKMPALRRVEDLVLVPIVADCRKCSHVLDRHRSSFMKCGAHGGRYCEFVNSDGNCTKWEPRIPKLRRSLLRWLWDVLFSWSRKGGGA